MQTITLKSDNTAALDELKKHATELNVEITEDEPVQEQETDDYYYWKGVKILKAKQPLDVKALSGSFPNLDLDPETFRNKLWNRNKE